MSEEKLNSIQELIERKILLAEVNGGLTSSDKKFIDLWNYTIDLQQELTKCKEVIDKSRQCIKDFLCSEEYINVDGDAIANNYENILDILKGEDKEVSE